MLKHIEIKTIFCIFLLCTSINLQKIVPHFVNKQTIIERKIDLREQNQEITISNIKQKQDQQDQQIKEQKQINSQIQVKQSTIKNQQKIKLYPKGVMINRRQSQQLLIDAPSNKNNNNLQQTNKLKKFSKKQYPFYCGSDINKVVKTFVRQKNLKTRQILINTNYGFQMYVDTKDLMVSNTISYSGTWEPNYINLIGYLVKPGHKVLNLGSQTGLEALVMGKIIGSTGLLFIFEPYSFSNQLVTQNIKLNNLEKITKIYKYGASDQKSIATIQVSYTNTGASQIVPTSSLQPAIAPGFYPGGINYRQEVQLQKVDDILPKDVSLDFALIDVQRMQVKALKGMKQIISRSPNLVIMSEWQYLENPRKNEEETKQLLNFLQQVGYKAYSYAEGEVSTCTIGNFYPFQKMLDLLKFEFLDVFFIPKNYQMPKN